MNGPESTSRQAARDGFLLAIPVFNEERHVVDVVNRARRYCSDILLIDDGSTDDTPRLLGELRGIRLIRHAENRGYGKSLADAFNFAIRLNYRWLITMDCDNQHEPSAIPRFHAAALKDDADLISGTRYPEGRTVDAAVPADRRDINRRITAILNRRLGLNLTDAFCGFKAYRVSTLASLKITVPGYAMPMQFWVQAATAGLRIREIPVRLIYNDPTRHFGGLLDDPHVRYAHYLEVLEAELARSIHFQKNDPSCTPCR